MPSPTRNIIFKPLLLRDYFSLRETNSGDQITERSGNAFTWLSVLFLDQFLQLLGREKKTQRGDLWRHVSARWHIGSGPLPLQKKSFLCLIPSMYFVFKLYYFSGISPECRKVYPYQSHEWCWRKERMKYLLIFGGAWNMQKSDAKPK